MTVAYCILNINKDKLLNLIKQNDDFKIKESEPGYLKILCASDKKYSTKKKVALGRIVGKAPDDMGDNQQYSSVFLSTNSPDEENTHFTGSAVSLSDPEVVLDKLAELAEKYGHDVQVVSEYDEIYQEMFMGNIEDEEINDDDLPK